MSETLSKIEKIKTIEYSINGVNKHSELIEKIIAGYAEKKSELPPVCCRVNPEYSNYMALDVSYLPMDHKAFWDAYRKNIKMKMESLQADLDELIA